MHTRKGSEGQVLFTIPSLPHPLILLKTTLIPELWPWLAHHSGGTGCNEACVLWTLRDHSKLCGCCCVPCACHHSAVLFMNISVPQSNKLMLLINRLTLSDVESIGLLKNKSISPSINSFFCLKDFQVGLSSHVQMEGNQVSFVFPLSWVLHWGIHFDFRGTERLQQKTLQNLYKWHNLFCFDGVNPNWSPRLRKRNRPLPIAVMFLKPYQPATKLLLPFVQNTPDKTLEAIHCRAHSQSISFFFFLQVWDGVEQQLR